MNKHFCLLSAIVYLLFLPFANSQPGYTANQQVTPYTGGFHPGVNNGYYPNMTNEILGELAGGTRNLNRPGAGAKAMRVGFTEELAELFGYEILTNLFEHYKNMGMNDHVMIVSGPIDWHRDSFNYCPQARSVMFKGVYLPIWDGGLNGTPYNDNNFFAAYMYKMVTTYKPYVKYWEIWNEPGFDLTGSTGWLPPGYPKNWWENDPEACDYILHAPVEHYIRHLRVAWEIVKTVDPTAYVTCSGVGYPAFLDAVLRQTDNPNGGGVTAEYPLKGGAYFDAVGFHSYPHFDGTVRYWDNGCQCMVNARHSDGAADGTVARTKKAYDDVLATYGYGSTFPQKVWTITEGNVPAKAFQWGGETLFGGIEAQRNFTIKNMVALMKAGMAQYDQYQIFDIKDQATATEPFEQMGLYEPLAGAGATPVRTQQGTAQLTGSRHLYGTTYDAARTAAMNLPASVGGGAFKQPNGKFVYAIWAKTTIDQSESASASYSFPASFALGNLTKRTWDYQTSTVSSNGVALDGAPIFLLEDANWAPPQTAFTGPTADLSLVMSAPASVPAGQNATFSLILTNSSGIAATNVRVNSFLEFSKAYLTDRLAYVSHTPPAGTTHDHLNGTWTIPSIAANSSLTLQIVVKPRTSAPYRAFAQVGKSDQYDPDSQPLNGQVTKIPYEDDEADFILNNNGFLETKPDLVIETIQKPASVAIGGTMWTRFMVRNNGRFGTPSAAVMKIFLSSDNLYSPDDLLLSTQSIPAFPPFGYQTYNLSGISIPTSPIAGNYFLIYKADVDNQIDEFEEGAANDFIRPIVLTGGGTGGSKPDLQPTSVTATGSNLANGQKGVDMNIVFKNNGPAAIAQANGFDLAGYFSTDANLSVDDYATTLFVYPGTMAAGASQTFLANLGYDQSSIPFQNGFFIVKTDPNNNVDEGNEANNVLATSISFPPIPPTGCPNNLLQNNGFESDFTNWDNPGGGTIVTDAQSGAKALNLCTAVGTNRIFQTKTANVGTAYTFKAFCKKTGVAPTTLFLKFMTSAYAPISTDFQPITSATYTEVTLSKTAPANTAFIEIGFIKNDGTGCLWADETCLTTGGGGNPCSPDLTAPTIAACPANINLTTTGTSAVATWTAPTAADNCGAATMTSNFNPGASFPIGSTIVTYTARDVANNSAVCSFSVSVTVQGTGGCVGNLLQNNGFESSFANWDNPNGGTIVADAQAGTKALSICTATGTSRVYQTKPATAGTAYTFKAFCKKTGAATASIFVKFLTSGFAPISTDFQAVTNAAYTEVSLAKTAPAGTAYIEVGFLKNDGTGCVLADEACLTAGGGGGNPCAPDVTAPSIAACPANQSATTATTSANVSWTAPTATDACPGTVTFTSTHQPGAVFPIGATTVIYTARDAANNSAVCNFTVTVTAQGGGVPNCAAASDFPWEDWLGAVKVGALEKTSSKSTYSDFTATVFNMTKAAANPLTLTAAYSYFTYDEYCRVWIDYNHDNIFQVATEKAFEGILTKPVNGTPTKALVGSISIPAAALTGNAKMRIVMGRGAYGEACGNIPFGEVEDYTVSIAQLAQGAAGERNPTPRVREVPDFQLFPNPASETVSIQISDTPSAVVTGIQPVARLVFCNQLGQIVLEKTLEANLNALKTVDVRGLPNGLYVVKMEMAGQWSVVKRLVVRREY